MKKIFQILFASTLLSFSFPTIAIDDTNAKIKAVFLYNFTKYIEWPESYKQGNFVIGVLGSSSIFNELSNMAAAKKAGGRSFEIKSFSSAGNMTRCHILFIPAESEVNIKEVLKKISGTSTLLITEKPGMAKQGAMINFVVQENKQKFELNKAIAEKYKLKISSNLVSLSIPVN